MYIFQTDRLRVRRFTAEDRNNFYLLNGDEAVMRFIRPVKDKNGSDALLQETLNYYEGSSSLGGWAIEEREKNSFVGLIMLKPSYPAHLAAEIGYALIPEHWNKGYASEIVEAVINYGWIASGISIFFAKTDPANKASQNVLLKKGFVFREESISNGILSHTFSLIKEIVRTDRLHIIPLTPELLMYYIEANNIFETRYGLQINNRIISPDVVHRVRTFLLPQINDQPIQKYIFRTFWIAIEKETKTIVGEIGFKGVPDKNGEVEIGYGTMPGYINRGFMTEMVAGLVQWAFNKDEVRAVLAETAKSNAVSEKILQKNNFNFLKRIDGMNWWVKNK